MPNDRRFSSIARKGMSNEPDRQAVFGGAEVLSGLMVFGRVTPSCLCIGCGEEAL